MALHVASTARVLRSPAKPLCGRIRTSRSHAEKGDHVVPDDQWIVVANWRKFQHYHDRQPTWLKLYTELNSRPDWMALSAAERGVLVTIWVEFARSNGRMSTQSVSKAVGRSFRSVHLDSLVREGFITIVSRDALDELYARELLRSSKRPLAPALKNGRASGAEKKTIPPPCLECGMGAGYHTEDCPQAVPSDA